MAQGWCGRRFRFFFTVEREIDRFEMDVDDLPGVAVTVIQARPLVSGF